MPQSQSESSLSRYVGKTPSQNSGVFCLFVCLILSFASGFSLFSLFKYLNCPLLPRWRYLCHQFARCFVVLIKTVPPPPSLSLFNRLSVVVFIILWEHNISKTCRRWWRCATVWHTPPTLPQPRRRTEPRTVTLIHYLVGKNVYTRCRDLLLFWN